MRRNVLENPAWYTAYTPYQPEISQGRLEALLNFQTVVEDLTGLPVAGASVLDEGTAAAEAVALAHRAARNGDTVVIDADALPQTIEVVRTRAEPLGLHRGHPRHGRSAARGRRLRRPGAVPRRVRSRSGSSRPIVAAAHERGAQAIVAADLLALTLLASPGEAGADIAVGTTQRFGVPLGFGGPHAGYLAVRAGLERQLPGRLVGRVDRRRRCPGLPAGAADPRAAHPPGEGDLQHLHRSGAAGGDGLDVRRLPRPRRPARHRPTGAPVHRHPRGRAARGRRRTRRRAVLRHPHGARSRAGRRRAGRRARRRDQPAPRRRRHRRRQLRRDRPRREHLVAVWRAAGVELGAADIERLDAHRHQRGEPRARSSWPTRCSTSTAPRPRCCATCAGWPTATSRWTAA